MNRYFTLPVEPLSLIQADGSPATNRLPHADLGHLLCLDARMSQAPMDTFQAYDLRAKLQAPPGSLVELTEAEHSVLSACVKNPTTVNPAVFMGADGQKYARSIVDASSKRPVTAKKP
jgi:hypothetical protein